MPQHDMDVVNQGSASFRSDMNLALVALVTNNSGATEPATMFANMWWFDTSTNILKLRSAANDAWISIMTIDQSSNLIASKTVTDMTVSRNLTNALLRMMPDRIENVGMFLSGGVITIKGYDGTTWSATNPAYVVGQSNANPGQLVLHTLTSDFTLTDSEVDGNLFGYPTGVAVTNNVEFAFKIVADASDQNPRLFITRNVQSRVAPAAANIGDPSSTIADAVGDYFCSVDITEASYEGNYATHLGKGRGTMNASNEWAFTALDQTQDGIGVPMIAFSEGWEPLAFSEASNDAQLDLVFGKAGFDIYKVEVDRVEPASSADFRMVTSSNGGSSYDVGATDYVGEYRRITNGSSSYTTYGTGTDYMKLAEADRGNYIGVCGTMHLWAADDAGNKTHMRFVGINTRSGTNPSAQDNVAVAKRESDVIVNALRFYFSSGNVSTGKVMVYGKNLIK